MLFPLTLALLQGELPVRASASHTSDTAVVITPGSKHGGGSLHKFFLGDAWRDLWTTPIRAPVANLDTLYGGLKATEKGGHAQTLSLRFTTPDGRTYNFRSIDKNPSQRFTGLMRSPLTTWFANDQISAMFPAAALVAGRLEHAAGLMTTERWLAVLPDSPRLGKWRDEFKGKLGIFERRYAQNEEGIPGIPGALELISSDSLFPRLQQDGLSVVDQREFLTARLFDILIGDWDRHEDQWSWVRYDRDGLHWWEPLPRDRDWALARFDGIAYDLVRFVKPSWAEFGPRYGHVRGLTSQAESLDRRLLTGLERETWNAVVAELQARLPDSIIDDAFTALPQEFDRKVLEDVGVSLRSRRDELPQIAAEYYQRLAGDVDVRASDAAEHATLTRDATGGVTVQLFGPERRQTFRRHFLSKETHEIRLYLHGGSDTVLVSGAAGGIPVRVITGAGRDLVADSTTGQDLRVYDDSGTAELRTRSHVPHIVRPFHSPVPEDDSREFLRDWGHHVGMVPWLAVRPEVGTVLGVGPEFHAYGFRRVPYQSRVALRMATTTKAGELNADFAGDFRFERPDRRLSVRAIALNADVIRYFGLGNETPRFKESAFNNVLQKQYAFEPTFEFGTGRTFRYRIGGMVRWSKTEVDHPTLLAQDSAYGSGSFAEAGAAGGLEYDSRDDPSLPTRGVRLELTGRVFPSALDVRSAFGSLGLVGATYLSVKSVPLAPVLAVRAGGMRVWGSYPFFDAATIGSATSIRGLPERRYAGDASLYASTELRLNLAGKRGHWGILGLADIGRVFLDGEKANRWHSGFGGGIWVELAELHRVITGTLASSGGRERFYLKTSFHF